jgi:hypothetical protein
MRGAREAKQSVFFQKGIPSTSSKKSSADAVIGLALQLNLSARAALKWAGADPVARISSQLNLSSKG